MKNLIKSLYVKTYPTILINIIGYGITNIISKILKRLYNRYCLSIHI